MAREDALGAIASPMPPYAVRVSSRARHVRLTVTPREGLTVVVPHGWLGDPASVVAEKRAWATRALERVAEKRAQFAAGPEALLPERVDLRACSASWPVEYRSTGASNVSARVAGTMLALSGDVADASACLVALECWLDREARAVLPEMLADVAEEAGIDFVTARVRRQRTRWGSCSAKGTISLSRNLVFLPEHLVRSLMLHELAHVHELNHSRRFWDVLLALDPLAHEHRAQMRKAEVYVPAWAEA